MSRTVILPPFDPAAPFPSASGRPAYDFSRRLAPEIISPALAQCRLPKRDEVFQVLAGDEWVSPPLRLAVSRRQFVLLPPASVVQGHVMVLRVAVTPLGAIILWPTLTERAASYRSQQAVIQAAEQGWVRCWKERREYRHAKVLLDLAPARPADPLDVLAEQAGLRPRRKEECHDRP